MFLGFNKSNCRC